MPGTLYIVGTPIGNLGDFSERAKQTLREVDFIAAEDTRVTVKLLNHFDIKKSLISYHEHNRKEKGPDILERILAGESCALVTDAGMPAISDPGIDLVRLCRENGVNIAAVPGPTALTTALAFSGMEVSRFSFEGFLTVNKPNRKKHLEEIKSERKTMVFYEAPHKLASTLRDLYEALGNRRIAIIKELTKIHESCEKTTLSEAAGKYDGIKLKGEYVLVIEAKTEEELKNEAPPADPLAAAKKYLSEGLSVNEASKRAAKETGAKKSEIYKLLSENS
ncbi:MAG: 16S rRNA (cytidine(1402)-2'-O)-methyltransferase [Oscillospiraceae bacterium]|nr:16S rRNA (cytidine(1402)-2'-O)-methyltransferase [Oscillospiraceae bacterium]